MSANFGSINLDNTINTFDPTGSFINLEKNLVKLDDPLVIKLMNMQLQIFQTIKITE